MGLSVNEFTYEGDDEFDLNFALGYASRGDVTAYKVGDPNEALEFEWLTDSRVRLVSGHDLENGDEVVFARTVSKLYLPVNLNEPGSLTREAVEEGLEHVMRAIHEVLDMRAADQYPWEITGELLDLSTVTEYDYLTTYTEARDGV